MKVLVTGATGFIGGNLARALHAQGYEVRALVRPDASTLTLTDIDIETMPGDVRDKYPVAQAIKGCQAVFHCAALYTFWSPDINDMYETNVGGTRVVLEEALKAGVDRVVHTSTVSTIGIPQAGLGTEEMEPTPKDLVGHYRRSKYMAEREALSMGPKGLPVVVVNPTAPVGPWDVKPTPTARTILEFLKGRVPVYMKTGMNLVDVEDVAQGHILALERGRPGERYILGHKNVTLKQVLEILARITGRRAPRLPVPLGLVLTLGYLDHWVEGKILRRRPFIPLEGVKHLRKPMYVNCQKAITELGMPQSPVEGALEKAVHWFRQWSYA